MTFAEAHQRANRTLAGSLSLETLLNVDEEKVLAEAHDAIATAGRGWFLLASDCVIRGLTPGASLATTRQAVEETILP